ncbi:MAG: AAA family ATPase [Planctomycetes bacterium]|nr:AAA family ATPase [Planctomycetota bacterium]
MTQPTIAISTNRPNLVVGVAASLEARGLSVRLARGSRKDDFQVTYKPGVSLARVAEVVSALNPAEPDTVREEAEQDHDIVVSLPVNSRGSESHRQTSVEIVADSEALAIKLRDFFQSLGYAQISHSVGGVTANTLSMADDVPTGIVALIRLKLLELGCAVGQVESSRSRPRHYGNKIRVEARDRVLESLPAVERFPVHVSSDSLEFGQELVELLAGHGFHVQLGEPLDSAKAIVNPPAIKVGAMGGIAGLPSRGMLFHVVEEYLRSKEVDLDRYPLSMPVPPGTQSVPVEPGTSTVTAAVVVLPVAACLAGKARSCGGAFHDRFNVKIRTDCPEHSMVTDLRERLAGDGFSHIEVELCGERDIRRLPLNVSVGAAFLHSSVIESVRDAVTHATRPLLDSGIAVRFDSRFNPEDPDIFINLPVIGWEDGSIVEEMGNAEGFDIKIHCEDPAEWDDVIDKFRAMGFDEFDIESASVSRPEMKFGGAPARLLDRVAKVVGDHSGVVLGRTKAWPDPDDDIYVFLPRRPSRGPGGRGDESDDVDPFFNDDADDAESWRPPMEADGPFVQATGGKVRVGGIELPRRSGRRDPLAPATDRFAHFCLDEKTAETLRHVAVSVLMNEPCLLEGETSTSKTSTIEYLASLLGQPIVRINLNGQTDTGELLGRFVPNELAGEGQSQAGWRWQDGLVIQALRNGWWLLLDEINLAETQILERLNSLLEAHPSLVLTEHGNEIFGDNGTPIHPDFRIFGTMNPAEYAGRSVMSPAYKDRWRGFRLVPTPGEPEYRSMLRLMVLGQQPSLVVDGTAYPGAQVEPSHPGLDGLEGIEDELDSLARFHATAASAAADGNGSLAARRKERPVFTRRSLLSVLDFVCRVVRPAAGTPAGAALRQAAVRYYADRVGADDDRQVLLRLLEASGLGQETTR